MKSSNGGLNAILSLAAIFENFQILNELILNENQLLLPQKYLRSDLETFLFRRSEFIDFLDFSKRKARKFE
jgi:hypothetical protein